MPDRATFENVLSNVQNPIILLLGPEHFVAFSNAAYNDLFTQGKNPTGQKIKDVLPEAMEQGFGDLLDQVYRSGQPYSATSVPYHKVNADGQKQGLFLDFTYAPKRNPAGAVEGVFASVIDVTQRVLALKEIETKEAMLSQMVNVMPQMSFEADAQGNITHFNERWHEYAGQLGKFKGWDWRAGQIHHPEDLQRTVETWSNAVRNGTPYEIEYRLRRWDGEYRWHLGRAVPVRDASGQIQRWLGTNTDIHDQKMAIEKIAAHQQLLSLTTNAIPELMAYLTPQGEYLYVNQAYENWFKKPTSEFLGKNILDVAGEKRAERIRTHFQHALSGVPVTFEDEAQYGDSYKFVRMSFLPDKKQNSDGARGVVLLVQDETERRRFESELHEAKIAAEQASQAKSAFLANMSHEIRTPLGAIMGFADIVLQMPELSDESKEYLRVIHRNSIQTLKIVDDILDLAKVEAGRIVIEHMEVDLVSYLADFSSLMGLRARENSINFKIIADSSLPKMIYMDPTRVRQILTNAVGNAIKFTAQGHVSLHVRYQNSFLEFSIIDTGRGITPEQAHQLFQPFVQADASTTRKYGGTGLGLILTKRLCQSMGGDYVLISSALNEGSHFLATLHAVTPESSPHISAQDVVFKSSGHESNADNDLPLHGLKVLVVEDSPDNQTLLRSLLERQGAVFNIAHNGAEGVQKALQGDHDVILMDVQMPQMDGHEAVRILRDKGFKRPIIALTAHAMREEYERAMKSGFTDYSSKPINRKDLFHKILKYTEKR